MHRFLSNPVSAPWCGKHPLPLGRRNDLGPCPEHDLWGFVPLADPCRATLQIDCRPLGHLFASAGEREGHIGTHIGAMRRCFDAGENADIVQQAAVLVARRLDRMEDGTDLDVILYCNWGKHRSVLIAWLLHEVHPWRTLRMWWPCPTCYFRNSQRFSQKQ